MLLRPCYVTNSSNTSFFGFGTVFDSSRADRLMDYIIDEIGLDQLMEKSYADPGEYETEEEQREYLKEEGLFEFLWGLSGVDPKYKHINFTDNRLEGDVYVYVRPKLQLGETGTLEVENAEEARPAIQIIQEWADSVGADSLHTVTGCWKNG